MTYSSVDKEIEDIEACDPFRREKESKLKWLQFQHF
jgi:hypothetical protein